MSKLAEQLRRIREGSGRVGFTADPAAPDRALLLVVALGRSDAQLVAQAVQDGADAIVVPWSSDGSFAEAVRAAGERLIGARLPGAIGRDVLSACREAGCTFVVFDLHAEAAVITERQLGLVLGVAYSWEDSLLRTVGELPTEALEGEPIVAGSPPLRLRDLLRLRRVLALTGRQLIMPVERSLSRSELETLVAGGVDAVEIMPALLGDSAASVGRAVREWRAAIDALPVRELRRRRERVAATLPFAGLRRAVADEEEEEDDE
jgi:hypothetical protein